MRTCSRCAFRKSSISRSERNLAEGVVIRIPSAATHAPVDQLSPSPREHSHGARMHDASHTCAVRLREHLCCSPDLRVVKLFPVPSAFVAVTEKRRGVEHDVIPLKMCGELSDLRPVTGHDLDGGDLQIAFLPLSVSGRAPSRRHRATLIAEAGYSQVNPLHPSRMPAEFAAMSSNESSISLPSVF
jgi:hypothetical protein